MNDIPHPELLSEITVFCEEHGVPKSMFGLEAVRDASLVTDLENGRECRRRTVERVRQFMADRRASTKAEDAA
mgnify:CR=1 FL=1